MLVRPVLPERDVVVHHHRALTRSDQSPAAGEMTADPGIVGAPIVVGPRHIIGYWYPRVSNFGGGTHRNHDTIEIFAFRKLDQRADHHPSVTFGAMQGRHGHGQGAKHIGLLTYLYSRVLDT